MEVCSNYNEKGQSIFEVVVAVALISLVLVTLVSMASLSIATSTFSRNQTQASRFTQQASEWLRAERDAGWIAFKSHAINSTWCLDSLTWLKPSGCASSEFIPGSIFKRVLTFTTNADASINATVTTSWVDARGTHSAPTSIVFANK